MVDSGLSRDREWAAAQAADLPRRWRRELLAKWERAATAPGSWIEKNESRYRGNAELGAVVRSLAGATAARLPLDATDADICQRADYEADRAFSLATAPHLQTLPALREAMARRALAQGIEPPAEDAEDGPAVARMTCPQWWRRGLRKLHARQVEGAAIRLGIVNRNRDPYCSTETLERRLQQNARNLAALEATVARNEHGQEFTLAELAAKGPANKAIRRAELMTRIAGFERIARDMGHSGLFMTLTCPSRMHRWRTVAGGKKCVENPRYDGTNPREANAYLAKVWSRIRAALARRGCTLYGFRIAEPQHDGTPHWHFLVFHGAEQFALVRETVRRYGLADSPDEPGADRHRCDFKPIDAARGTAAGYIAKYVAKNIDGYRVGEDLLGNSAMETSARVEAWAAAWRIRQFQQIGGPPVGVWRELRRVEEVPAGAPAHLVAAHRAANKLATLEGRDNASVAWDHYVQAQGGVYCGRDYRVRLAMQDQEGTGRYGDALAPKVIGVQTTALEVYTPAHMAWMGGIAERTVHWIVESARHVWEVIRRAGGEVKRGPRPRLSVPAEPAQPAQPWTCVNNCTEGERDGENEPGADARSVGWLEAAGGGGAADGAWDAAARVDPALCAGQWAD